MIAEDQAVKERLEIDREYAARSRRGTGGYSRDKVDPQFRGVFTDDGFLMRTSPIDTLENRREIYGSRDGRYQSREMPLRRVRRPVDSDHFFEEP